MAWKGVFLLSLLFISLAESSTSPRKLLFLNASTYSNLSPSWPILSAGAFVAVTLVLSFYLIFEHLGAYNQPEEQKFLIGLILMVPVYAVESFLSLLDSEVAFICEIMRDCYEAFAMYCFERYLIACLGGEESTIKLMETEAQISPSTPLLEAAYVNGVVEHPFPLNCLLKDWYLGPHFYQAVKIGIVQYMILKTVCALLAIMLQLGGVYGEGKFEWRYGYPYLAVVLNFSQTWALYCLVQFYSVTKEKLEPIKPLAKFLVFKSIVFLTWWQGVIVAFLFSFGLFKSLLAQELKTRIQDYIICIEMGVAAVVHLYVFPAKPYQRGERCVRNVAVMADYASLDAPPDPEELRDSEKSTRIWLAHPEDKEKRLNFPQSVRDVVLGSGGIMVDDVKFTVSHVVEPVERGIARINETFHQISQNVKQHEKRKRKAKDDCYLIPLHSRSTEFTEVYEHLPEGSVSDSGLARKRAQASTRSS
uniref:Transmembrane protein 184C n=2 Tax=Anthurium amnicola TaxID=1678845 RepID=A0A1D1XJ67_9ARAE